MDGNSPPTAAWSIFSNLGAADLEVLIEMLNSSAENQRRWAVQTIVDLGDSPIQHIECWPELKCTRLQLFAAETIIGEWLKQLRRAPGATEEEMIEEMFPEEEDAVPDPPRVRKLAKPASQPGRLARALDRLSENVKDTIIDLRVGPEPNEFTAPYSEDIPLRSLDPQAFEERMRPRLADSLEVAAGILSKPATDRELAECSEQLNKVADSFRWNLLEVAMELRTAENPDGSDKKESQPQAMPASWAKKFRLMRASGF
jgi:hypothetical protein